MSLTLSRPSLSAAPPFIILETCTVMLDSAPPIIVNPNIS